MQLDQIREKTVNGNALEAPRKRPCSDRIKDSMESQNSQEEKSSSSDIDIGGNFKDLFESADRYRICKYVLD